MISFEVRSEYSRVMTGPIHFSLSGLYCWAKSFSQKSRIMEKHQTAISQDVLKTRPPTGLLSCFMSPQPLEHVHQPAFIQINTSLCSDQKIKAEMIMLLTRLIIAAKL